MKAAHIAECKVIVMGGKQVGGRKRGKARSLLQLDDLDSGYREDLHREPLNPRIRLKQHLLDKMMENLSRMISESTTGGAFPQTSRELCAQWSTPAQVQQQQKRFRGNISDEKTSYIHVRYAQAPPPLKSG